MHWQNQPEPKKIQLQSHVIRKLSPHPNEWMEPGEPTRVFLEDVRDIPTIKMPYSTIPRLCQFYLLPILLCYCFY
ncbi:MAG: hypothetical protein ACRCT1_03945 [Microcoleaceae cyanobacterium]